MGVPLLVLTFLVLTFVVLTFVVLDSLSSLGSSLPKLTECP